MEIYEFSNSFKFVLFIIAGVDSADTQFNFAFEMESFTINYSNDARTLFVTTFCVDNLANLFRGYRSNSTHTPSAVDERTELYVAIRVSSQNGLIKMRATKVFPVAK